MRIEGPRPPEETVKSIRSHVVDAFKEVSELNRGLQEVFNKSARLAERQRLIRIAVAKTALKIIGRLPIEWTDVGQPPLDKEGKVNLEIQGETFLGIKSPARRLLILLTGREIPVNGSESFKLVVRRLKPQPIQKEEGPIVDFHRMELFLIHEGSTLGLHLTWDEDPKIPDAAVEFSCPIRDPIIREVLFGRLPLIDSNDQWRQLEDASGFLTLLEKSRPVSSHQIPRVK